MNFIEATQTKNFLSSFRLSAEGSGEEPCKEMEGSFLGLPARVRERGWGASGRVERTKKSQATTRSARASVASRLEIGSSGAVYSQRRKRAPQGAFFAR